MGLSNAERQQRWRERRDQEVASLRARVAELEAAGGAKPSRKPQATDAALQAENAALSARIRELEAENEPMPRTDGALRREISRLRDDLTKMKFQLLMAQDDLKRQIQAGAPNPLVLALQHEIKSLKGKLAHEKAQALPPSEREAKLRETIRKLGSRLRKIVDRPPRGTLIMSRRDKLKIVKCLHVDKRKALDETDLTEALQIWNGLNIREP
jgi:chromosome segregation ATPase